MKTCVLENCNGKCIAKGYCSKHYQSLRKKGLLEPSWKIKDTSRMGGHVPKSAFKKGATPWNKGTKGLMNAWNKGKKTGFTPWNKGMWGVNAGDKNPNWKGGVHSENNALRRTQRYKQWRHAVFERDDYTCQHCNARGIYLEADHIKPFAFFPELRFELTNGRTLCKECHMKTPTYKRHKIMEEIA